ncbi:MAG: undecaprenyl diphosphate synthase family protein [Methanosarcinaceae archaeon]|nr:undecaprenyl diphosphate synthase family protein [Methanosarcinaceae archaeon]
MNYIRRNKMIRLLYERYLITLIQRYEAMPSHIAIVLSETDLLHQEGINKLTIFVDWCRKLEIKMLSFYIDVLDTEPELEHEMVRKLASVLRDTLDKLPEEIGFTIYNENGEPCEKRNGNDMLISISVGFGGRKEVTKAVVAVLSDVKKGNITPEQISDNIIESHLLIHEEPDLIMRAGGKHLSDFLIWQSAYSELYFTDVNWYDLRKIELLRVIRDFQKRQRRYGK